MKKNNGFSFIEVMVCVVILSTGLLGLMGLQVRGLKTNISAQQRTQATLLAYSMIDKMRANAAEVVANGGAASGYVTKTISNSTTVDPACQPETIAAGTTPATTCTAAKMVVNDLVEWNRALTAQYCNGATTIVCNGTPLGEISYNAVATAQAQLASPTVMPAPQVFTVTISWDDNRNDVIDNRDPADPAKPCYVKNTTLPTLDSTLTQFDSCFRTDFQL